MTDRPGSRARALFGASFSISTVPDMSPAGVPSGDRPGRPSRAQLRARRAPAGSGQRPLDNFIRCLCEKRSDPLGINHDKRGLTPFW